MTLIRLLSDPCHDTLVTAARGATLSLKSADKRRTNDDFDISPAPRSLGFGVAAIRSFDYCSPMHSYP